MKKLLLSLLLGCAGLAHATSVLFPINSMFGGAAYGQTITLQAVNTLYVDGVNMYAGTYINVPSTGTNPIVSLQPNSYLLTIAGVVKPVRFTVPTSTNVLNLVSLIPAGTVFYFSTNGFANLVPGTGMAFVTNSDGSITLNSASLSLVFTNGPGQLANGVLAISTNYDALGAAWTTFAYNATSGVTAFNLSSSYGLPISGIVNGGNIITNNQTGNVQFINSTVTVSNLLSLGAITGANIAPSSQSSGQLNINMGSGMLIGSTVNVGNISGNGSGITGINAANVSGTFTGNGGGLTNLNASAISGTLNPALSATQSIYAADIVSMTNQPLSCASIGGILANAASKGYAVALGLGDSYTASTGLESIGEGSGVSTSYIIGKQLRLAYGDGGCAGACSGVSYGWANSNPGSMNPNLIVPTNIWPHSSDGAGGTGIAVLTTNVGTNAIWTSQINNVNGWVPVCSNIVNLAGICYVTSTNGGSVQVSIGSPSSGVTNSYTLNTLSYAPGFVRTNWPVASAADYSIVVTNLTGATNYIVCPVLLNTNGGLQYWQFGFAGSHNDTILSIGTNMWWQIYAAVNPDLVIYNDIHFGSSTDPAGTNTVAYTNALVNWLSGFPAKTVVNMIGNPPNNGGSQQPINYWYKVLCCSFTNWTYTDLWSPWASFTNSFNLGMFETTNNTRNVGAQTGVHPSMAGMWARAAEACKQMNVRSIVPSWVPASSIVGIIPLGSYAAAVMTNGMANAALKDLTVTGGASGLAVHNLFLYDGSTEMAVAGGGELIFGGQLEVRYVNLNFTSGPNGINGASFVNSLTNSSATVVATNNIAVLSGGTFNGNGTGLTNLQASNLTGNQGRVVTTSGPSIALPTGVTCFPLGYWNPGTAGAGMIAGFAGLCSNFCFSVYALGPTNISVYIGTNLAVNSETYIGTIFPTSAGFNYTNWTTSFYNNNLTNQLFLVLSNWSATTTAPARFQLTFTY